MQRDARSSGRGGVGRAAVGARGHGGGVEVGGGVPPRRGVCAVLGDHLSECKEEEEEEVIQAQQTSTSNLQQQMYYGATGMEIEANPDQNF